MTCTHKLDSANENCFDYARESLRLSIVDADDYATANESSWAEANEDPCTACDVACEHLAEAAEYWTVQPTWDDSDGYVGGTWAECENPF